MTTLQRLQLEQSEKRQRINELLGVPERTDEQTKELDTLTKRMQSLELELRAAIVADPDPETVETRTDQDAEGRERRELIGKCRVAHYFGHVTGHRKFDGAEAELAGELGMGEGDIPLDLFKREAPDGGDLETRAITPVPATVGVNMQAVEQMVFAPSIAARLGISIRDVPSGTVAIPTITTAPAGNAGKGPRPKAKEAAADSTQGAITVASATPKRIPARLSIALEDVAAFGNDSFEMALREALQLNLSHSFDDQIINGTGAGANLTGLIKRLNDISALAAQGAEVTWANAQTVVSAFVDGTWATMLSELAVVVNPEGYRKAASTFQAPTTSGANGEVSLASYLMEKLASFFTNSRMPATPSANALEKNATLIVGRVGQPGATRAVVPSWGRIAIDDPYTNSDTGLRHFTVSAIVGDLMLVHADAFALGAWQVKA